MYEGIALAFLLIFLSEFGDKTQLMVFTLSNRTKNKILLFFTALLAFALVDGIIIYFGEVITNVIPNLVIQIIAAALFFYFGLSTLFEKNGEDEKIEIKKISKKKFFLTAFLLLALAEMGDKSQIAAFVLATQYGFLPTFIGLVLAFGVLTGIAILVSCLIKKEYVKYFQKGAGVLFIIFGIVALMSLF